MSVTNVATSGRHEAQRIQARDQVQGLVVNDTFDFHGKARPDISFFDSRVTR
jgi:hypothetical protein